MKTISIETSATNSCVLLVNDSEASPTVWLTAVYDNMHVYGISRINSRKMLAELLDISTHSRLYKTMKVTPNVPFNLADLIYKRWKEIIVRINSNPEPYRPSAKLTVDDCVELYRRMNERCPQYLG